MSKKTLKWEEVEEVWVNLPPTIQSDYGLKPVFDTLLKQMEENERLRDKLESNKNWLRGLELILGHHLGEM